MYNVLVHCTKYDTTVQNTKAFSDFREEQQYSTRTVPGSCTGLLLRY